MGSKRPVPSEDAASHCLALLVLREELSAAIFMQKERLRWNNNVTFLHLEHEGLLRVDLVPVLKQDVAIF